MTLKIPTILVLLNHCNFKEAIETKDFTQVFTTTVYQCVTIF